MIINDYDYFIKGILKSSDSHIKEILKNTSCYYTTYEVPKKAGFRTISGINKDCELYLMQKNLCTYFLSTIPLPSPVIGFVKEESYISYLTPHIGKRFFLRIDIKNFFDSINSSSIRKGFSEFFSSDDKAALDIFVQLCTLNNKLPQGAVTSPAISNIVFRYIDQRILKYCQSFNNIYENNKTKRECIKYTRYADDLLFSSNVVNFEKKPFFIGMIISILKDNGFQVNKSKTRCSINQISMSGFVLGEGIHLSRNKLHELNHILYFFGKTKTYTNKKYRVDSQMLTSPNWLEEVNKLCIKDSHGNDKYFKNIEDILNYLCGYRSFLISIIRGNSNGNQYTRQLNNKIKKLECIIESILKHS